MEFGQALRRSLAVAVIFGGSLSCEQPKVVVLPTAEPTKITTPTPPFDLNCRIISVPKMLNKPDENKWILSCYSPHNEPAFKNKVKEIVDTCKIDLDSAYPARSRLVAVFKPNTENSNPNIESCLVEAIKR